MMSGKSSVEKWRMRRWKVEDEEVVALLVIVIIMQANRQQFTEPAYS